MEGGRGEVGVVIIGLWRERKKGGWSFDIGQ